jgi:sporulation protein YunB
MAIVIAALTMQKKQTNKFSQNCTPCIKYTRGVFLLYHKSGKSRFSKLKKIIISIISLLVICVIYCEIQLSEFAPEYIKTRAKKMSSDAICQAVNSTLEELNYSYNEIAKIIYSDSGSVKSIETDSRKINEIKNKVTQEVQYKVGEIQEGEVYIPLGVFTNITVLSNVGPKICMNFSMTGDFSSEIISTFEQAGVNQTIHHIRLMLTSKIMTTSLDYSGDIIFTTDYEIAQTVIVGEIPNYYGNLYSTNEKNYSENSVKND